MELLSHKNVCGFTVMLYLDNLVKSKKDCMVVVKRICDKTEQISVEVIATKNYVCNDCIEKATIEYDSLNNITSLQAFIEDASKSIRLFTHVRG